jgi:dTDP-4-dehydrorhamnose reductase
LNERLACGSLSAVLRVFVSGLSGMLGHSLAANLSAAGHSVAGCGTRAPESLSLPKSVSYHPWRFGQWSDLPAFQELVRESGADVLLHAAAYTKVDLAEQEEAAAHLVNGLYTQAAARVAEELSIDLVYVSTDYVFDGRAGKPYREWDEPAPLGVYGRSKLEGEVAARRIPRHYVVRTSWLFGEQGPNFVATILNAARERPELKVVDDQFGSPTYTGDLAAAIAHLIGTRRYGVHHLTNSGVTTWCDFAREILAQAGLSTPVHPQTTAEAGRPAPRPAFGALENWAWHLAGEKSLPPWQDALGRYLASIGALPVGV